MKNFEEWEGSGCTTPDNICNLVKECSACTQLKEEGWRAALMWVLIAEWNTPDELTELLGKELKS